MLSHEKEQKKLSKQKNLPWIEAPLHLKAGVSKSVKEGLKPT